MLIDFPTVALMIAPTIEREGAFHCVAVNGHLGVLVLAPPGTRTDVELQLACALHHLLDRGVLVLVP